MCYLRCQFFGEFSTVILHPSFDLVIFAVIEVVSVAKYDFRKRLRLAHGGDWSGTTRQSTIGTTERWV